MAIQAGVRLPHQERHRVRSGTGGAVAEGGVVAARLGACRRRGGWVPGGIGGGSWVVTLGADGGVGRIGGGVREDGTARTMPGLRRVGSADTVAGETGEGRGAACEILAVTDLAGGQASARDDIRSHFGVHAVDRRIHEAGRGLMVAARGHAGRYAAAHLEDGDLMALGAGVDARDGLTWVLRDPANLMVVTVVLGRARSPFAPATGEAQH